jgi:hypothetical protein
MTEIRVRLHPVCVIEFFSASYHICTSNVTPYYDVLQALPPYDCVFAVADCVAFYIRAKSTTFHLRWHGRLLCASRFSR